MTKEAKTEDELRKAYNRVLDGEVVMWVDFYAVIVDMERRIKELEAEVGRYRDKANSGSDEGH